MSNKERLAIKTVKIHNRLILKEYLLKLLTLLWELLHGLQEVKYGTET
jgi:hypothetical protein